MNLAQNYNVFSGKQRQSFVSYYSKNDLIITSESNKRNAPYLKVRLLS